MEQIKLVDLVLDELISTHQPSVSVRRVFKKKNVDYTDELIRSIEVILESKSLVNDYGKDSRGYRRFALSATGQDFIKTYGTYSKFLKGVESENKKIERARRKKPYQTHTNPDGKPPLPYNPQDESFLQKNRVGLLILMGVLVLFYIVSKITERVV